MAIPKVYDGAAVRPCVWGGDPYLSVLLFPKKKKENSPYILVYAIFIKKN